MRELFKYWSLVISLCEMDPWTPQNSLNSSDFPSTLPPPFEFGQRDINSDQYLSIIGMPLIWDSFEQWTNRGCGI